jgi:hypothetical protein
MEVLAQCGSKQEGLPEPHRPTLVGLLSTNTYDLTGEAHRHSHVGCGVMAGLWAGRLSRRPEPGLARLPVDI